MLRHSETRFEYLTHNDPVPADLKRTARTKLGAFKSSELYDPEDRVLTASHEAAHALITILNGQSILDVWVSEYSTRVNEALGILDGFISNFETTVFEVPPEESPEKDKFDDLPPRISLLSSVDYAAGSLMEHILRPEDISIKRIEEEVLSSKEDKGSDFSLLRESLLDFISKRFPETLNLDEEVRDNIFIETLESLLETLKDYFSQIGIQEIITCMANKFLKESRMRGPQVKGQILQELRNKGILQEDLDLARQNLFDHLFAFETNLEKKLANLLESP